MLSKEVVEARFGHLPATAAEARSMTVTLIAEMQTRQIILLVATIKATKKKNPAFLFGLQVAETELTRR